MTTAQDYSVDDWLVHAMYGIGQIKGIEEKDISGSPVRYFKIETNNSTFWIPVDRMDAQKLRPLSTAPEIQVVIDILLRPPRALASDRNARSHEIRRVQLENSLADAARLVRDLRERHRRRGELSIEERNAMRALRQRVVDEWAFVTGEPAEKVERRVDDLLNNVQSPAANV